MTNRVYSEAERAEAVALSYTLPVKAAAKQLGIPWRNLYEWRRSPSPVVAGAIEASRADVARSLWQVVEAGSQEALRRIRDKNTRAGELAQLLKVAAEQHALLTGGVTARSETRDTTETMTDEQRRIMYDWLDELGNASDDELRAWAADGGLAMLRDMQPEAVARAKFAEERLLEAGESDA